MQIAYNQDNLEKNYLNSYVNVSFMKEGVSLSNSLFHTEVFLLGEEKKFQDFLTLLKEGMSTEDILKELSFFTDDAVLLYENLLQKYIIE